MTGDRTLVAEKLIHVSYEHFVRDVQIGDKILVDDGDVELIVRDKKENCLELEASNPGEIKDKKSINVPGVNMHPRTVSCRARPNPCAGIARSSLRFFFPCPGIVQFVFQRRSGSDSHPACAVPDALPNRKRPGMDGYFRPEVRSRR